jgi:magnesium chelatase family protein
MEQEVTMTERMPCGEPVDLQEIRGLEHVKRGLEVAAAGGHHVLLIGAPESGKTTLARALLGLVPPLSETEAASVTALRAMAGQPLEDGVRSAQRPCVAPRPDVSTAQLYGGGAGRLRPGAVSRAHRGLLLLDDLPAFGPRLVPLAPIIDERTVRIERPSGALSLPAAFQLVATARPCPCGFFGDAEAICTCTPALVRRYQRRIPASLRDRIEIHLEVPRLAYVSEAGAQRLQLTSGRVGEPSTTVAQRVVAARRLQRERFLGNPLCTTNAELSPADIRTYCALDGAGHSLMKAAVRQLDLSAGAYQRTLRLARTIADLAGSEQIGPAHLAESLQYRSRPTL